MTKERKYSLITLEVAEEDDVDEKVVHVGADRMREASSFGDVSDAAATVATDPADSSSGHAGDTLRTEPPKTGDARVAAPVAAPVEEKPLSGGGVHEEDFEGEVPFARLRLIVLGCLVLLVIGFVIYNLMGH